MKRDITIFYPSIVLIAALAYFIQTKILFSPDVGYLLFAAKQILAGAQYGRDIFETNPPMILYLYIPVWWLVKYLSLNVMVALRLYVLALSFISIALCNFLLKKLIKQPDTLLIYCLLYTLLLTELFLPMISFGQREHLLLILMLPYLFSAALALEKQTIPRWMAIIIGLLAGLGFALKPFFLTVPCLVELYFILHYRRLFAWVRIESLLILGLLGAYYISIVILQPGYIDTISPLLFKYYFPTIRTSLFLTIQLPHVLFCLSMIGWYSFFYDYDYYPALGRILWLAIIGMVLAFIIPQAPWYYHILPALALSCLLLVHLLIQVFLSVRQKMRLFWGISFLSLAMTMILFLPLSFSYRIMQHENQLRGKLPIAKLAAYFNQYHSMPSINCFGKGTSDCFPLVYQIHAHYSSRFPAFWWLTGIRQAEKNAQNPSAKAQVIKDRNNFIDIVAQDISKGHTQFVLIDQKSFSGLESSSFDILSYLSQDSKFREAWRHFHYVVTSYPYKIYQYQ